MTKYEHADEPPPWFVMLGERSACAQIGSVVNRLVYAGNCATAASRPWTSRG